jgi:hypothetical protein
LRPVPFYAEGTKTLGAKFIRRDIHLHSQNALPKIASFYHFFSFLPELPEVGKFKMDYQSIFATIIQRLLLTKYATRDRVVRAFFGLSIPMLSRVYWLISQPGGRGKFVAPMDLLIALHFVKKYETEDISCILFHISGKTWKSHLDAALVALYLRLPEVC